MSAGRALAGYLALSLLLAACSGSDSTDTIPGTTVASTSSTTTIASSTTAPPTSSTTTTTTTVPAVTDDEVLAAWLAYWDVWALQRASDPIDRTALEAVASPSVADAAIEFFERERESGSVLSVPRVFPSGTVTSIDGDRATMTACTLITRSPSAIPGSLYDVAIERVADGSWIVSELSLVSGAGCVPTELAEAAIEAYEAYWDDRDALSNPADPGAEWLADRTTGQHFEVMTELYADLQDRGLYFKGRPQTHPEVVEVMRDWSVVVLDCMAMPEDWGVYEIETGERTDDAEPVGEEGRIDLRSAIVKNDMADASGAWRLSTLSGEVDVSCEFAPTENALPQS